MPPAKSIISELEKAYSSAVSQFWSAWQEFWNEFANAWDTAFTPSFPDWWMLMNPGSQTFTLAMGLTEAFQNFGDRLVQIPVVVLSRIAISHWPMPAHLNHTVMTTADAVRFCLFSIIFELSQLILPGTEPAILLKGEGVHHVLSTIERFEKRQFFRLIFKIRSLKSLGIRMLNVTLAIFVALGIVFTVIFGVWMARKILIRAEDPVQFNANFKAFVLSQSAPRKKVASEEGTILRREPGGSKP